MQTLMVMPKNRRVTVLFLVGTFAFSSAMECVDSSELIEGQTCEQAIATYGPRVCYNTFFESHCCATCTAQQTGIPDCMYGDWTTGCRVFLCSSIVNPRECCFTCRPPSTTTTTTTTTTTATTTTTPITTTTLTTTTAPTTTPEEIPLSKQRRP